MLDRRYEGMGRVAVEIELANAEDLILLECGRQTPDQVRRLRTTAVVAAKAMDLVLPAKVAEQLGVPAAGMAFVRRPGRRRRSLPVVRSVRVDLLGRDGTFKAVVDPKCTEVRIGHIALEDLDLLVDPRTHTLQPRDPRWIIAEIE